TNSLRVAQALMESPRVEVILTGGTLRRPIHALVGPATEESVRALRASQAFISGNGFTADRGLSTPSPVVAATDRALAGAAQHVVVLADHTKIGQETMCQTVPAVRVHTLITDSKARASELDAIRATGVEVRVAESGEHVASAAERNDRTFLPTEFCPLCPSGTDGHSEVPLDTFEIVVFENRFPAFGPDRRGGRPVRPASTGCEVVVYTPEHELTLAQL